MFELKSIFLWEFQQLRNKKGPTKTTDSTSSTIVFYRSIMTFYEIITKDYEIKLCTYMHTF